MKPQGRLEMFRGRVREAEATLQELHGQVGGARNAAAVKKTIGEAEAEAPARLSIERNKRPQLFSKPPVRRPASGRRI